MVGAPGQLVTAMAPAKWRLWAWSATKSFALMEVSVQVARCHVVLCNERLLDGDNFVQANVGVKLGLDVAEGDDRAIGAVTTVNWSGSDRKSEGLEERTQTCPSPREQAKWPPHRGMSCATRQLRSQTRMSPSNSQTKSFVSDIVTLAAFEHVLLNVVADVEQLAAS